MPWEPVLPVKGKVPPRGVSVRIWKRKSGQTQFHLRIGADARAEAGLSPDGAHVAIVVGTGPEKGRLCMKSALAGPKAWKLSPSGGAAGRGLILKCMVAALGLRDAPCDWTDAGWTVEDGGLFVTLPDAMAKGPADLRAGFEDVKTVRRAS